MDFASDQEDLLQIVSFFESLFKVLVERVPDRRAQFRRVLNSDILPRLQRLRSDLQSIKAVNDQKWQQLREHGLNGEPLRLKFDEMEDAAHKGLLGRTFRLSNVVLGSFAEVFGFLKPVKEYKEVLEQKLLAESEPVQEITTLFGPGPIPGPSEPRATIQGPSLPPVRHVNFDCENRR
jgi:hypothetical protein